MGEGYLPTPRELIVANDTLTRKHEIERIAAVGQILASAYLKEVEKAEGKGSPKTLKIRKFEGINLKNLLNMTLGDVTGDTGGKKSVMQPRLDNPQTKKQNDSLIQLYLSQEDHQSKMQLRKSEAGVVLDGIAPSKQKTNLLNKLQREPDAEETNSTTTGEATQSVMDVLGLWNFIYELANVRVLLVI